MTLSIDLQDESCDALMDNKEQTLADNYVIQKVEKWTFLNQAAPALSKSVILCLLCLKKFSLLPSKFFKRLSNDGGNKMIETS